MGKHSIWKSREEFLCIRKTRSIFIRKASSNLIFHYSPFSLNCFKYSLLITKIIENIIYMSTVWKFKFWSFQLQYYMIVNVLSLLHFHITYSKLFTSGNIFFRSMPPINVDHSAPSRKLVIPQFKTSYGIFYKNVLYPLLIWAVNDPLWQASL